MSAPSLRTCVAAMQQRLSPPTSVQKVSIAIDGGGVLHLDAVAADVRMRTQAKGACLHVAVGGMRRPRPHPGRRCRACGRRGGNRHAAPDRSRRPAARARDIVATDGAAAFLPCDRRRPRRSPPHRGARQPTLSVGMHCATGDWRSALVSPSVMRMRPWRSRSLHRAAADLGARGLRTTAGRRASSSWASPRRSRPSVWRASRNGLASFARAGGPAPPDCRLRGRTDLCCGGNFDALARAEPCEGGRWPAPKRAHGARCQDAPKGALSPRSNAADGRWHRRPVCVVVNGSAPR